MPGVPLGGAFRRRLTIAFVLVVAVCSGVMAVTSFVLIREYRVRSFTDQAVDKAALSLISTPDDLSLTDVDELLAQYERRGGFETVVVATDLVFSSDPGLGADDVPQGMDTDLEPGELVRRTTGAGDDSRLVVGGVTPSGSAQLFFFFSRLDLLTSIKDFRNVLWLGWLISVATAALFGNLVARRTLRPVNEASRASELLASGLLDTRLESSSDDEFGRWANSFNRMAEALQEKIHDLSEAAERERRFTANVAHDLRTPLTGMVSAASLLDEDLAALPPETAPAVRLLVDDAHRLKTLVTELLELARLDAGQEQVNTEALSLAGALRAVTDPWDGTSSVRLDVEEQVTVLADRARFRRVVGNLVDNALQHGGDGVVVRGYQRGDRVVVEVHDQGPGIDEKDLAHVFDRFFKADRSRSTGGSGLGLSIALANAQLQGGSLSADNLDGGGACFAFTLPAGSLDDHARPGATDGFQM